MNRLAPAALLSALLAAACALPGPPAMTASHAAAIRDSVQTLLDTFQRLSGEGKWDSLAGLYADDDDFRWLEQGVVLYRSPAQIREALRRVAPGTTVETSYLATTITPLGPGAAALTTMVRTQFMERGVERAGFTGVLDMVLVHREGGWKILMGHSSSSQ